MNIPPQQGRTAPFIQTTKAIITSIGNWMDFKQLKDSKTVLAS
jgi:hypothetical protein